MKNKIYIAAIILLSIVSIGSVGLLGRRYYKSHWREWNNYPPFSEVRLDSTNLPIILLDTDGSRVRKDKKIEASMVIIDNGDKLNYADTILHNNQYIDYEGSITIKYRGNTSYSRRDKKQYSIHLGGG